MEGYVPHFVFSLVRCDGVAAIVKLLEKEQTQLACSVLFHIHMLLVYSREVVGCCIAALKRVFVYFEDHLCEFPDLRRLIERFLVRMFVSCCNVMCRVTVRDDPALRQRARDFLALYDKSGDKNVSSTPGQKHARDSTDSVSPPPKRVRRDTQEFKLLDVLADAAYFSESDGESTPAGVSVSVSASSGSPASSPVRTARKKTFKKRSQSPPMALSQKVRPPRGRARADYEKLPFVCEEKGCGARFLLKNSLSAHRNKHSSINQCSICGKGHESQSLLAAHMRHHTGEKPFQCYMCKQRFTHRNNCIKHESKCSA